MKKNRLNAVGGGFIVLVKCCINKCDPSAQGSKDDAWRNTERRNSWYAMVIPVNCDTTLSAGNTLKSIPSKRGACLWYTSTWWVDFCYIILKSLRNNHHKQPPALLCYSLPPINNTSAGWRNKLPVYGLFSLLPIPQRAPRSIPLVLALGSTRVSNKNEAEPRRPRRKKQEE